MIHLNDREISPQILPNEFKAEKNVRPTTLYQYIGQDKIKENLKITIASAKVRQKPIDHLLFYGPPGLGKTTLASIIAHEMNVNIKITSGPAIERPGDLAAIITNLQENDILFIDEIHRLNRSVEEILYPAMEDFQLDIIIGKGPSARSIRLDLPAFTLIGATTQAGRMSSPLRDRFGSVNRLEFYNHQDLQTILLQAAGFLDIQLSNPGAMEIAKRSRGTPRIANRLLRRARDWALVKSTGTIDINEAHAALDALEIDALGLDKTDKRFLHAIISNYQGGPVGIETIAASIAEEPITIEDIVEPFLMQLGFINRTPRGRIVTPKAYAYLGIKPSKKNLQQELF